MGSEFSSIYSSYNVGLSGNVGLNRGNPALPGVNMNQLPATTQAPIFNWNGSPNTYAGQVPAYNPTFSGNTFGNPAVNPYGASIANPYATNPLAVSPGHPLAAPFSTVPNPYMQAVQQEAIVTSLLANPVPPPLGSQETSWLHSAMMKIDQQWPAYVQQSAPQVMQNYGYLATNNYNNPLESYIAAARAMAYDALNSSQGNQGMVNLPANTNTQQPGSGTTNGAQNGTTSGTPTEQGPTEVPLELLEAVRSEASSGKKLSKEELQNYIKNLQYQVQMDPNNPALQQKLKAASFMAQSWDFLVHAGKDDKLDKADLKRLAKLDKNKSNISADDLKSASRKEKNYGRKAFWKKAVGVVVGAAAGVGTFIFTGGNVALAGTAFGAFNNLTTGILQGDKFGDVMKGTLKGAAKGFMFGSMAGGAMGAMGMNTAGAAAKLGSKIGLDAASAAGKSKFIAKATQLGTKAATFATTNQRTLTQASMLLASDGINATNLAALGNNSQQSDNTTQNTTNNQSTNNTNNSGSNNSGQGQNFLTMLASMFSSGE